MIHNNSLHYLPLTMAGSLHAPTVTTLHTPPFCWLESGVRLGRGESHIVAVSQATSDLWQGVARIDGVIPNGIDLARFPFAAKPADDAYLVWYGRIVPEKGLHLAIAAARAVGLPLKIAGPRSDNQYYDEMIAPLLGGDVSYLGHLSHDELARLIQGARVALCTPRWEEPYGLVVAEALSSGTPVAAFHRGGISAILDESCGALAEADDVPGLARAVRTALTLDRAACRRRAEDQCDARRMVDAYERLYHGLVASRSALREPRGRDAAVPVAVAVAASA